MIKINTLLRINGILTAFYAVTLLFAPGSFFEMRGMHPDASGIFVTQLLGVPSQFGYAFLSIMASRLNNPETLRLVAIVNCITWTLGLIVLVYGKMTLGMNGMLWGDISAALIFSLAFASCLFAKRAGLTPGF